MTNFVLITADIYNELEDLVDPLMEAIEAEAIDDPALEQPRDELVDYINSLWGAIESVGDEEAAEILRDAQSWAIHGGSLGPFEEADDFEDQILFAVDRATQLMGDLLVPATEEGYRDDADLGRVQSEQIPLFSEDFPSVELRGTRYVFVDEFRDAY